jgi:hypothetical protein
MKDFLDANQSKIQGVLSCFDRMLFRGYLPIQDGASMAAFLNQNNIRFRDLKSFLIENAEKVEAHAQQMAREQNRPYEYLQNKIRMESQARERAERDRIEKGLICIFSMLEPCRTFSFRFKKGKPFAQPSRRKCLHIYYYFMDPEFGLIHVKVQTWFPMVMQVYLNGHDWLARKLSANSIGYTKVDNAFLHVEDLPRAQSFADRFCSLNWSSRLDRYARRANPLMHSLICGQSYYWVAAQSEYSTDVLFKSRSALKELYPRLLSHSTTCFGAKEVMSFFGRKLHGKFEGEIVTDMLDLWFQRIPGARVKHRVKENWIKMYDKAGMVLRIETVINNPEEFKVRRKVVRSGRHVTEWVPMRKGVHYLFRYKDVSLGANSRYLDALSVVSDPTARVAEVDRITHRKRSPSGRTARALNPLAQEDLQLFQAVMDGSHSIRGFTNREVRTALVRTPHLVGIDGDKRRSAKVSRILHRLHLHKLIAKIPRSRKWRTTRFGRRVMATAMQVRQLTFPQLLALAP